MGRSSVACFRFGSSQTSAVPADCAGAVLSAGLFSVVGHLSVHDRRRRGSEADGGIDFRAGLSACAPGVLSIWRRRPENGREKPLLMGPQGNGQHSFAVILRYAGLSGHAGAAVRADKMERGILIHTNRPP